MLDFLRVGEHNPFLMSSMSKTPRPPRLINITEGSRREVIPLGKVMLLIGRGGANLNFEDSSISANHASIVIINGKFHLRDNGSTNGSFVNGKRVTQQEIKHQDIIRFGPHQFLVELSAGSSVEEAPHDSVPLVTIPASHKNDNYKVKYAIEPPVDSPDGLTIVTSGHVKRSSSKLTALRCPSCAATVKQGFSFCPICGAKLTPDPAST